MIALLDVHADATFTALALSSDCDEPGSLPSAEWLHGQMAPAMCFQQMRGPGTFVLSLPGV